MNNSNYYFILYFFYYSKNILICMIHIIKTRFYFKSIVHYTIDLIKHLQMLIIFIC
jgi:hypothetical protein